jgi:transposase
VTQDDLLYRFRLRSFAIAAELGNVRAACRAMGIHPSTYYRWKGQLDRYGPEILRPRERRVPRMANATSPLVEQRVVAFALGHPGFGPARIAAELAKPKWGGISLSANGVWRVLRRHGLSTRAKRYGLVAGYAAPPAPERPAPPPERHLDVHHPGQLVQLDCLCIGRLSGTKGTVWQYTAIDVASASTWATLQVTRRNPSATWTSALARQVAADLASRGWRLERVMSDNASEFRSATFQATITKLVSCA